MDVLCLVSVVCCQLGISGKGRSLVQRSPTVCVCACMCVCGVYGVCVCGVCFYVSLVVMGRSSDPLQLQ